MDLSPRYRIEREATERQMWQFIVNCLRRLFGLRIKRTGQQEWDEYLRKYGVGNGRRPCN